MVSPPQAGSPRLSLPPVGADLGQPSQAGSPCSRRGDRRSPPTGSTCTSFKKGILMARAPNYDKTNALRELDAAGIPHEGAVLRRRAHDDRRGRSRSRRGKSNPRRRLQDARDPGQVRRVTYVFLVPVAAELDLKKAAAAAGEKAIADDQGPRASAAHRLCARRLLAHRHEEALSHLRG